MKIFYTFLAVFVLSFSWDICISQCVPVNDSILTYCANPAKQHLKLYWRDENKRQFRNFVQLRNWLAKRGQKLLFAMNGGMYKEDRFPLGLYIDSGKVVAPLNKAAASGNFYLKPNGIFFITKQKTANVCRTEKFKVTNDILYATQSGPMLLVDGKIHPSFTKGSANINIRNAVGILPNGNVLFAMTKRPMNFYDFARFFLSAGCKNALYLDGFISQAYLPAQKWEQPGGNFGVIIAETNR